MAALAAVCGALIGLFGVLTTRRAPSDAQFGIEITCLLGGLVLIFLGVLLARVDRLGRRIDGIERPPERGPPPREG